MMQFLLRQVIQDQGQTLFQDTELAADEITIGSAPDQLIQLRGGNIDRQHAVLQSKGGKLTVSCIAKGATVSIAGEPVAKAELSVGDEVCFENHRLTIVAAPSGFDAACELNIDDELQEHAFESAYVTDLSQTFLAKRGPAYLLSLLILALAFAYPFSAYLLRDSASPDPVSQAGPHQGDYFWSSGPLLPAHQVEIGDDCSACHKQAFQQVPNNACVECHQGTNDHFSEQTLSHISMGVSQCQACHKEHNEPGMMIVESDQLCVDCHQSSLKDIPGSGTIAAVKGFDTSSHPEFKLNYLLPTVVTKGTGLGVNWLNERHEFGSSQQEVSNLKFPHDVHLDIDKVQTANTGDGIVCNDCHTLQSDKEHFQPIAMEQHCSACHDLTFDSAQPERQLPHGDPRSVVQTIEEHFVKVYADPDFKDSSQGRKRRRPGQDERTHNCDGSAFQCGMQRAVNEANIQFTQRGCVTCHEVSDNSSDDIYARWQVLPVKITPDWYVSGTFDHASHLTQRGQSEVEVCSSCHDAKASQVSSDVMIPGMENCLQCHGDVAAHEKVTVNCVSCHAFHPQQPPKAELNSQ